MPIFLNVPERRTCRYDSASEAYCYLEGLYTDDFSECNIFVLYKEPADLGQLQFYLEVLDKDIKKPHENPSIGILICKTKDDEVVKYALNRHASPTMIAEYETKFIQKSLREKKLHEISKTLEFEEENK